MSFFRVLLKNDQPIFIIFLIGAGFSIVLGQQSARKPSENFDLDNVIGRIFNIDNSITSRRRFDDIVTPVPSSGNQPIIEYQSKNGRKQCRCVPYHMCQPSNSTNDPGTPAEDGSFDGFGIINLRSDLPPSDEPSCTHYLEKCCESERTSRNSLTPTPQNEKTNRLNGCGIRNINGIDFNLVGANNNEAGFGEFPWTIALLHADNSSYFCAGSLINLGVVLTASHCVSDRTRNSFKARAGEWDTQTTNERLPYQERDINRIIIHPNYNGRSAAYDFALLILNRPFTSADHINVVCLPEANTEPISGTPCISTGWGKDVFGAEGRYSAILKRIILPIVDHNTCENQLRSTRLGRRFSLNKSFLCAGGERGIDTCEGDGGAPLICPNLNGKLSDNRFHQSGIVAWGLGCKDEIPAAYAHVALVRDWIDDEILANGFTTLSYTPP